MQRRQAAKSRAANLSDAFEDEGITMGTSNMSMARLHQIIDSDRRMYYRSLDLNDKLYIHFQGFRHLENLEKFTGLRSLFAEANAIEEIACLETCTQLRSLFLQQNCIKKISGLENNTDLWSMNLSENWIETIENIEHLRHLNNFTVCKNRIGVNGLRDVIGLRDTLIATLDLSDNKIADPEVLPQVFGRMKDLKVLYLKGNPVVKMIPNYRKTVIAFLPELKYLDDRPVFVEDRRAAEAFVAGGLEGEREMRKLFKKEKEQFHEKQMAMFKLMVEESKTAKREIALMRVNDKYTEETDPYETWRKRQERFLRENPEYDYESYGKLDKKPEGYKKPEGKADFAPGFATEKKPGDKEKKPAVGPDAAGANFDDSAPHVKEKAETVEKAKEVPPPPDWDADIFGESAHSEREGKSSAARARENRSPPPRTMPTPTQPKAEKATFAPPPRTVAEAPSKPKEADAFGPRGAAVNELDELD